MVEAATNRQDSFIKYPKSGEKYFPYPESLFRGSTIPTEKQGEVSGCLLSAALVPFIQKSAAGVPFQFTGITTFKDWGWTDTLSPYRSGGLLNSLNALLTSPTDTTIQLAYSIDEENWAISADYFAADTMHPVNENRYLGSARIDPTGITLVLSDQNREFEIIKQSPVYPFKRREVKEYLAPWISDHRAQIGKIVLGSENQYRKWTVTPPPSSRFVHNDNTNRATVGIMTFSHVDDIDIGNEQSPVTVWISSTNTNYREPKNPEPPRLQFPIHNSVFQPLGL